MHSKSDIKRIIIIDPGCTGPFGHHRALDQLIVSFCRQNKIASRVLVAKKCTADVVAELGAEARLTPSVYLPLPDTAQQTSKYLEELNRATWRELNSALPDLSAGDIIVVHTTSPWHFRALYNLAQSTSGKGVRFRIVFRFPPKFAPIPRSKKSAALATESEDAKIYRELEQAFETDFALWKKLDIDVQFFADTYALARKFKTISGIEMPVVPIQIDFSEYSPSDDEGPASDGPVFLFAGNGRREKGVQILPEAVEQYLRSGLPGRFVIQAINLVTPAMAERLNSLGPKVSIFGQALSGAPYFKFLSSADVVLVPYDPESYTMRTSHIFIEALGIGRPVITTKGTWMEEELTTLGEPCGVLMETFSAEALCGAMVRFSENRNELSLSARKMANTVREKHNAAQFIRTLLG